MLADEGGWDVNQPTKEELWREHRFLEMDCEPALARTLSTIRHLDLHEFYRLRQKGSPPQLAARILLPDDYLLSPI